MYEHRYRENKLHGQLEFPLHIYRVEHQARVHSILPVHWHNEMEIIYLAKAALSSILRAVSSLFKQGMP